MHINLFIHERRQMPPPSSPPPLLAVGSIASIFIFVIYSKSNSCQSQIKNSKFTTGRKQLLLHLQQDHSKILKTCHPALCSPTSAAICFLLKHYTKKRCYFHAFRSAQESETDSVKPPDVLSFYQQPFQKCQNKRL